MDSYIFDTTLRIVIFFVSASIFITYPFWVRCIIEDHYF